MLLPPYEDDELHPQVVEALKRLEIARASWVHAREVIENQYLTPLTHTEASHQADSVRLLLAD